MTYIRGVCVRCKRPRRLRGRGLCQRCHPVIRRHGELDEYRNPNVSQIDSYRELLSWSIGIQEAADRLGVTERTILRYRIQLRRTGELPPYPRPRRSQIDSYRELLAQGYGRFGNRAAAERLGLTEKTITRYRARLRRSGELEELER